MRVTTVLSMAGSIFLVGNPDSVYIVIWVGWFLLGIGVGGIYPSSVVHSAEGSSSAEA